MQSNRHVQQGPFAYNNSLQDAASSTRIPPKIDYLKNPAYPLFVYFWPEMKIFETILKLIIFKSHSTHSSTKKQVTTK